MQSTGTLDSLLKSIAGELQHRYRAPDWVYGFVPQKSTVEAAWNHVGAKTALAIDLKEFFGQISETHVRSALASLADEESINVIVGCCLTEDGLPLGLRTSPVISNLVFLNTDLAIEEACAQRGIRYTRWVDDMVFSGEKVDDAFLKSIVLVIEGFGWKINDSKTRFMNSKRVVLGLNIAPDLDRPHVPRGIKRELRKQLYFLEKLGEEHFRRETAWSMAKILGMISYVRSVDPDLGTAYTIRLERIPDSERLLRASTAKGGGWQLPLLKHLGMI